jgi:hypothetical protein
MLFFRSEELAVSWCQERRIPPGPTVKVERLWALAQAWYGDRLAATWRRRELAEAQAILSRCGLRGPFWQLTAAAAPASDEQAKI